MPLTIASSLGKDPSLIADELKQKLGPGPRLLVFFSAPQHSSDELGRALAQRFPGIPSIGCTTAGEMLSGRMLEDSVVAAGFGDDILQCATVASIEDPHSANSVLDALSRLVAPFGGFPHQLDPAAYVGIVLHDSTARAEEEVMATLRASTNFPFVGGSAARYAASSSERPCVFTDFEAGGGAALALLSLRRPCCVVKTQSFDLMSPELLVTQADLETRTVHAFNERPAASEYARVLGIPIAELAGAFASHPLGLVTAGGEIYVRSPQRRGDDAVVFYCQIKEGMRLRLLCSRNIVADTQRDLAAALDRHGECRGILSFNCSLRARELSAHGQLQEYAELFSQLPTVGFATFGESYIGHINQTATMILF